MAKPNASTEAKASQPVENTNTTRSIMDFRSNIADLARPNLFQVKLTFPELIAQQINEATADKDNGDVGDTASKGYSRLSTFLCKAAALPATTVGVIEVPYRGRVLKIAGDRTFEPWTVTILNDEGFNLRNALEGWANAIQMQSSNYQTAQNIAEYQSVATVHHTTRQNIHNRAYEFVGVWPSNISSIDLAWDSNDTAEEYTVEFQVQYYHSIDDTNNPNGKPE